MATKHPCWKRQHGQLTWRLQRLSASFYLSIYLSIYIYIYPSMSHSMSLCMSLSISLSMSPSLSLSMSLSMSLSLSHYIYICCRVENPSKNCPFLSWKSVHFFCFFFFCFCFSKIFFFLAGRMIFFKKIKGKKREKKHNFLRWKSVQLCCATYLDGFSTQPWTDLQLNNFVNFGPFFLFEKCRNHNFYSAFSQTWII